MACCATNSRLGRVSMGMVACTYWVPVNSGIGCVTRTKYTPVAREDMESATQIIPRLWMGQRRQ